MKRNTINLWGLQLRSTFTRLGWVNGAALIICAVGVAAWLWGIPQLRTRLNTGQQDLVRAQQALQSAYGPPPVVKRSAAEERLTHFYETLGEKHYAEQQVKMLFAIAAKSNLTLSQAEYKFGFDKNGRYHTYQIQLPVKGSYSAIRQFCEQTLLAIPFASLDEVNFKRESITHPVLEAKLRFTLYLNDAPTQQEAETHLDMKRSFQ